MKCAEVRDFVARPYLHMMASCSVVLEDSHHPPPIKRGFIQQGDHSLLIRLLLLPSSCLGGEIAPSLPRCHLLQVRQQPLGCHFLNKQKVDLRLSERKPCVDG